MTRPTQTPGSTSDAKKRLTLVPTPCCDAAAKVARVWDLVAASGTTWERPVAVGKPYTFEAPVEYALVPITALRAALDGPAGGGVG